MKIACICSTKNEADVIESFVRLNGRICDSFFFADDSTDNTRAILSLLVQEGYDLSFLPSVHGGHNQPTSTKAHLAAVKRKANPDWIFLLDADEIIVARDKDALIEEISAVPPDGYLAAEWRTFVPVSLAYFESTSPLSECFALRKDRHEAFRKISVPGRIVDHITTTPGNHSARSLSRTPLVERPATSYYLAHFPVRSAQQIIVKNLIAMHNLVARSDAEHGEGFHVFPVADLIRRREYALTIDDLTDLATNYARPDHVPTPAIADDLDRQDNPWLQTELRYRRLASINVIGRLDSEIDRLSKEIRERRRGLKFDAVYFQSHRG